MSDVMESSSKRDVVYLLCFDRPSRSGARHYLGWTNDLANRLDAHRKGRGSCLTKAIRNEGIGFSVSRVWDPGTRSMERRLKNRHQLLRLCPNCRPQALARHAICERHRRKNVVLTCS